MSMIKRLFGGARPSEPEASAPAEPPGSDKTPDSRTFQVDNAQAGRGDHVLPRNRPKDTHVPITTVRIHATLNPTEPR